MIGAGYKILSTIFLSALRYHLSAKARTIPRERLLIFTRFPEPGATKTRLIPALGVEGAADLQRQMTERVLALSKTLDQISVEVVYTGGSLAQFREWLGEDWEYRPQAEGDLGHRMRMAFLTAFLRRAERAVIVGVDCPELSAGIVASAFRLLEKRDVVLGPATDGGYYLIGIRRRASRRALETVFNGIDWGTENVFGQTTKILGEAGVSVGLLACLDDVDRPEDLPVWGRACGVDAGSPRFSVIIPTLDEEDVVSETIRHALASESTEVLVVDGGSSDETVARATECGARVMPSHACRAAQMNLGAARARGEILVFLHADTHLPAGFEDHVQRIMDQSGVIAGAFKFRTDDDSATMRFIEWWANVRSKWLKMPYGDQALFLRKDTFREIGGYRELPIMDDLELVRRLGRRGRIPIAPADAVTSCRRWRRMGKWRTTITNQLVVLAYFAGLPPRFVAQFYDR